MISTTSRPYENEKSTALAEITAIRTDDSSRCIDHRRLPQGQMLPTSNCVSRSFLLYLSLLDYGTFWRLLIGGY